MTMYQPMFKVYHLYNHIYTYVWNQNKSSMISQYFSGSYRVISRYIPSIGRPDNRHWGSAWAAASEPSNAETTGSGAAVLPLGFREVFYMRKMRQSIYLKQVRQVLHDHVENWIHWMYDKWNAMYGTVTKTDVMWCGVEWNSLLSSAVESYVSFK